MQAHPPTLPDPRAFETDEDTAGQARPPRAPAAGSEDVSPIVLDPMLSFLVSPSNLQIHKPQRMPGAALKPFLDHRKEIMLLPSHSKRLLTADLGALRETYLFAHTRQASLLRACGDEVLLVIFPVLPKQHYVVQTWVDDIYRNRVKLRYQDPRYHKRWNVDLAADAALRVVPPEFLTLIETRQVQLTRGTGGLAAGVFSEGDGWITDSVRTGARVTPSPAHPLSEAVAPLRCRVRDISAGGLCVTLLDRPQSEHVVNRIVQVDLSLPRTASEALDQDWMPMRLSLLGVVRRVNEGRRSSTAHIRFLKHLPAEMDRRFEAMDECCQTTGRPLE